MLIMTLQWFDQIVLEQKPLGRKMRVLSADIFQTLSFCFFSVELTFHFRPFFNFIFEKFRSVPKRLFQFCWSRYCSQARIGFPLLSSCHPQLSQCANQSKKKKCIVCLDFSSSSSWVGQSDWICDLLVQNALLTTLLPPPLLRGMARSWTWPWFGCE